MKRTRIALTIIHTLCPGPGRPAIEAGEAAGAFPFATFKLAAGSLFLKYASMPETRCSSVGGAGGATGSDDWQKAEVHATKARHAAN